MSSRLVDAGHLWKRGNGALSQRPRARELPLRDDDDDPWPGRCLVAYKLLLVVTLPSILTCCATTNNGEYKDTTRR